MRFAICGALLALTLCPQARADEGRYYEAARRVAALSSGSVSGAQMQEMISGVTDMLPGLTSADQQQRLGAILSDIFSSETYLDGQARIFMELYTEEELIQLEELMSEPVYRKFMSTRVEQGKRIGALLMKQIMESEPSIRALAQPDPPDGHE